MGKQPSKFIFDDNNFCAIFDMYHINAEDYSLVRPWNY